MESVTFCTHAKCKFSEGRERGYSSISKEKFPKPGTHKCKIHGQKQVGTGERSIREGVSDKGEGTEESARTIQRILRIALLLTGLFNSNQRTKIQKWSFCLFGGHTSLGLGI